MQESVSSRKCHECDRSTYNLHALLARLLMTVKAKNSSQHGGSISRSRRKSRRTLPETHFVTHHQPITVRPRTVLLVGESSAFRNVVDPMIQARLQRESPRVRVELERYKDRAHDAVECKWSRDR